MYPIILRSCLILCLVVAKENLFGQVELGLNAPSLKWKEIESPHYRIVFPESRENDARVVSGLLDKYIAEDSPEWTNQPFKTPIILRTQSAISNGFVTLAPWRSEFFLNPPQFQFAGITPWLDLLTIHEFRHIQQISQARYGPGGKLLKTLFGQSGWAFNQGAIQPRWFLEGDAVFAETIYSQGGRGRTASFENQYRAMRLAGMHYNYEKASFWSYVDFVPNHYHLGYYMTTHARRKYGNQIWKEVLDQSYGKVGLYRFSKALKKLTGETTVTLYQNAMEEVDSIWDQQNKAINYLQGESLINQQKRLYTNYRYPSVSSDHSVIAVKSSLNQINTIVEIDGKTGTEQKLTEPGIGFGQHLSVAGNLATWSELRFHPRWHDQSYSVIMVYDLDQRQKRKLTSRSAYFSPSLSPDASKIAAVEVLDDGSVQLAILETATGNQLVTFPADSREFFSFPRWHPDGDRIMVAVRGPGGNFIRSFSFKNRESKQLMPLVTYSIDRITTYDKFVLFSSSRTGVQNIFALNHSTGEIFQLTESRFGAFDPTVDLDKKKLIYSEYTAMGYELRALDLNKALWRQGNFNKLNGSNYFIPLLKDTPGDITNTFSPTERIAKPFKYFTSGLFNIHSWFPFITTEEFGFQVLTRNIMSTVAGGLQFSYNTDENSWKTSANINYGAFLPLIEISGTTGERQTETLVQTTDTLSIIGYRGNWREHSISGGVRIPLDLSHGNYFTNVNLFTGYRRLSVDYFDEFTDSFRDENFGAWEASINFNRFQQSALQNILPRWGQSLSLRYFKTLDTRNNPGERFTLSGSLVFPGMVRNHSMFLTGSYQHEDIVDAYRFEDIFTDARGYGSGPFEKIYRISVNYTFPIWYPDLSLGSLSYFKRLRGNLFYDHSEGELLDVTSQLRSAGIELQVDLRFIRLVDIGAGVRLGYQIDQDRDFIELIISNIQF